MDMNYKFEHSIDIFTFEIELFEYNPPDECFYRIYEVWNDTRTGDKIRRLLPFSHPLYQDEEICDLAFNCARWEIYDQMIDDLENESGYRNPKLNIKAGEKNG